MCNCNNSSSGIPFIVGFIFTLSISMIAFMLVTLFTGFHYQTTSGSHTGFITATQEEGVFYKTNTVFVKTELESSQEDAYCVIDTIVYDKLREYEKSKKPVTVSYVGYLANGIASCSSSNIDVITSVEERIN